MKLFLRLFKPFVLSWLRERVLRVPEADLTRLAAKAGTSADQWRVMESVLADHVEAEYDRLVK